MDRKRQIGQLDTRTRHLLENSSSRGAVLVSFGSVADPRQMPREMREAFLNAFAAFPAHTFIWKLAEEDEKSPFMNSTKFPLNVHRFDWLDQRGILGNGEKEHSEIWQSSSKWARSLHFAQKFIGRTDSGIYSQSQICRLINRF